MKVLGADIYVKGVKTPPVPINREVLDVEHFRKIFTRLMQIKLRSRDLDIHLTKLEPPDRRTVIMLQKAKNVILTAVGELGYCEKPDNSNLQKYGEWYGMNGVAWCAIFVSWVFDKAGLALGHLDTAKGFHYTPSGLNWFKSHNMLTSRPAPGDIVFFDWRNDGRVDHVGIYLQDNGDGATFMTIEGNTSVGNDSNGGSVMIRRRSYNMTGIASKVYFVHPKVYDTEAV